MIADEETPLLGGEEEGRGDANTNVDMDRRQQQQQQVTGIKCLLFGNVSSTFLQANEDIWSYLTLFSACVNILTVDGAMYSNGLFTNKLSHYLEASEEEVQRAATLEVVCSAVFSLVATLLTMYFGPKLVAVAGSSIAAIGWLSAAKMVTNTSQLILCQSALVGVGFGLMYVPSIVAVGAKFSTNRSWALGCATCGNPVTIVSNGMAGGADLISGINQGLAAALTEPPLVCSVPW